MTRWYEDITIDEPFPLGSHNFTEAEIIRFGQLYDPQYFHVDPEAAKQSHFGGLVASGWHTVTVGHRHMVDALFAEEERLRGLGKEPGVSGPSPGVNSMEFKAPVRPGDTRHLHPDRHRQAAVQFAFPAGACCSTPSRRSTSAASWSITPNWWAFPSCATTRCR